MLLEVLGRWEDEDSREPLAVVAAKVSLVAGEQMRGFGGNGEGELRGSGGRVDLDRQRNGGPDEDAILALLSDDERAFFDAELPSQPGGDDDGATLADPAGLRPRSPDCLTLGHTGILAGSEKRVKTVRAADVCERASAGGRACASTVPEGGQNGQSRRAWRSVRDLPGHQHRPASPRCG